MQELIINEKLDETFITDATNGKLMEAEIWDVNQLQRQLDRQPFGRNVIIRRRMYQTKTASGIHTNVHDESKDLAATQGMVVSIGPDVLNLIPGDEVVFKDYEGRWITGHDGGKFYLIHENFIQALVGSSRELTSEIDMEVEKAKRISRSL